MCGAQRRRGFGLRPPARRALTGPAEGLTTGRVRCEDVGMRGSFFLSVRGSSATRSFTHAWPECAVGGVPSRLSPGSRGPSWAPGAVLLELRLERRSGPAARDDGHGLDIDVDRGFDLFQRFDGEPFSVEQAMQEARLVRGAEVVYSKK